jgi:hypothetical protein|tara:strand:+ start:1331 stop:1543 length:213 start_codon:yes stop_codon:yes gene_type:complete
VKKNRTKIEELVRKITQYLDAQIKYTEIKIDEHIKWESVNCCCPICPGDNKEILMDKESNFPDQFKEEWK